MCTPVSLNPTPDDGRSQIGKMSAKEKCGTPFQKFPTEEAKFFSMKNIFLVSFYFWWDIISAKRSGHWLHKTGQSSVPLTWSILEITNEIKDFLIQS